MSLHHASVGLPQGDAQNPVIYDKDDTDNGIYFDGDEIAFAIAGNKVASFDANGLQLQGTGVSTAADFDISADDIALRATDDITLTGDDLAVTMDDVLFTVDNFVVASNEALALAVGPNGSTTPCLVVDASTSMAAGGVGITGAAAGSGATIAAIGGTNEPLTINAKGSGDLKLLQSGTGTVKVGTSTAECAGIKGIYLSSAINVAVPTMAMDTAQSATTDVSTAFTVQPAVGDAVIAIPQAALTTNAILGGAHVSATDMITVAFATEEGAGVTGANVSFKFLLIDLT